MPDESDQHIRQQFTRLSHRSPELDQQQHPRLIRLIPNLVVIGIVEDYRFTHSPDYSVAVDIHPTGFGVIRHDQTDVSSHDGLADAAVSPDVRTRPHHRVNCAYEPGHILYRISDYRAPVEILLNWIAVTVKKERPPVVGTGCNPLMSWRKVAERGNGRRMTQYAFCFLSNLWHHLENLSNPWKVR